MDKETDVERHPDKQNNRNQNTVMEIQRKRPNN